MPKTYFGYRVIIRRDLYLRHAYRWSIFICHVKSAVNWYFAIKLVNPIQIRHYP